MSNWTSNDSSTVLNYTILKIDVDKIVMGWSNLPRDEIYIRYVAEPYVNITHLVSNEHSLGATEYTLPFAKCNITSTSITLTVDIWKTDWSKCYFSKTEQISLPAWPYVAEWDWNANEARRILNRHLYSGEGIKETYDSSYGAIVPNFRASVWNDLINKTLETVKAGGAEWFSAKNIATYDASLVVSGDELKASQFNALVFNIGNFKFPWKYDDSIAGFLGRKMVAGRYEFQMARKEYGARSALIKIQLENNPSIGWYDEPLSQIRDVSIDKDMSIQAKLKRANVLIINGESYNTDFRVDSINPYTHDFLKYAGKLVYCTVNDVENFYYLQLIRDPSDSNHYFWAYYYDGWVPYSKSATSPQGVCDNLDTCAASKIFVDAYGAYAQSFHPYRKVRYYINSQMFYTDGWAFLQGPSGVNRWFYFDSHGYVEGDGFGYHPISDGTTVSNIVKDLRIYNKQRIGGKSVKYLLFWMRPYNHRRPQGSTLLGLSVRSASSQKNYTFEWGSKYNTKSMTWMQEKSPNPNYEFVERWSLPVYISGCVEPYASFFVVDGQELGEGWAYLPNPMGSTLSSYSWYYLKMGGDGYKNSGRKYNKRAKVKEYIEYFPYDPDDEKRHGKPQIGWYHMWDSYWVYITELYLADKDDSKSGWIADGWANGWAQVMCDKEWSQMSTEEREKEGKPFLHNYSHWFYFDKDGVLDEYTMLNAFWNKVEIGETQTEYDSLVDWDFYGRAEHFSEQYIYSEGYFDLRGPFYRYTRNEDGGCDYGIPNEYVDGVFSNADGTEPLNTHYSISVEDMRAVFGYGDYLSGISNEDFEAHILAEDGSSSNWYYDGYTAPTEGLLSYMRGGVTTYDINSYYKKEITDKVSFLTIEGQELAYPDIVYANYFKYTKQGVVHYPITDSLNALIRSVNRPQNAARSFISLYMGISGYSLVRVVRSLNVIYDFGYNILSNIRGVPERSILNRDRELNKLNFIMDIETKHQQYMSGIQKFLNITTVLETNMFVDIRLYRNACFVNPEYTSYFYCSREGSIIIDQNLNPLIESKIKKSASKILESTILLDPIIQSKIKAQDSKALIWMIFYIYTTNFIFNPESKLLDAHFREELIIKSLINNYGSIGDIDFELNKLNWILNIITRKSARINVNSVHEINIFGLIKLEDGQLFVNYLYDVAIKSIIDTNITPISIKYNVLFNELSILINQKERIFSTQDNSVSIYGKINGSLLSRLYSNNNNMYYKIKLWMYSSYLPRFSILCNQNQYLLQPLMHKYTINWLTGYSQLNLLYQGYMNIYNYFHLYNNNNYSYYIENSINTFLYRYVYSDYISKADIQIHLFGRINVLFNYILSTQIMYIHICDFHRDRKIHINILNLLYFDKLIIKTVLFQNIYNNTHNFNLDAIKSFKIFFSPDIKLFNNFGSFLDIHYVNTTLINTYYNYIFYYTNISDLLNTINKKPQIVLLQRYNKNYFMNKIILNLYYKQMGYSIILFEFNRASFWLNCYFSINFINNIKFINLLSIRGKAASKSIYNKTKYSSPFKVDNNCKIILISNTKDIFSNYLFIHKFYDKYTYVHIYPISTYKQNFYLSQLYSYFKKSILIISKSDYQNFYSSDYDNQINFHELLPKSYSKIEIIPLNYSNIIKTIIVNDWIYPYWLNENLVISQTFYEKVKYKKLFLY